VSTDKDQRDRRVTRVFVTDRGRSIRETVLARRREEISNVLAAAGPIDAAGVDSLQRIGRALRAYT
jgi:DNA-binding MarR family transcriptional regulator